MTWTIAHCFSFILIAARMQHWRRLFIPANPRTSLESWKRTSRAVFQDLKRSQRTQRNYRDVREECSQAWESTFLTSACFWMLCNVMPQTRVAFMTFDETLFRIC